MTNGSLVLFEMSKGGRGISIFPGIYNPCLSSSKTGNLMNPIEVLMMTNHDPHEPGSSTYKEGKFMTLMNQVH